MSSVRTRNGNSNTLASLIGITSPPPPQVPQATTMVAQSQNCRALVLNKDSTKKIATLTPNPTPKSSQFSYFLSINFTNTKKSSKSGSFIKVRIKIPKLLVKTLKKKQSKNANNSSDDRTKVSNVKKVTSMLAKTFVCQKPETVFDDIVSKKYEIASISDGKETNGSILVEEDEEFGSQRWEITDSEYSHSFRTNSIGSTYSLRFEIDEANLKGVCPTCKRPLEMESATTKNSVAKAKNSKVGKRRSGSSSDCSSSSSTNVVLPSCVTRGGDGNGGLSKSSRNLMSKSKIWISGSLEKKVDSEEIGKELELCKKKILRGERCRRLEDDTDSVKYIEA